MSTVEGHPRPDHRIVILHYHLFKNAGTSVDFVLRENFGERWTEREFPAPAEFESNSDKVAEFIRGNPGVVALSSHTALLPEPTVPGVNIFSIVFIRHPIDRLRSAYTFEREQDASTFGAILAKKEDLAGYLRTLVSHPSNRSARNFQTLRLAMNEDRSCGSEIDRAQRALGQISFVGLVEAFADSLRELENALRNLFPAFTAREVRRNVTQGSGSSLAERLSIVRDEIGEELFDEVTKANEDDLALFALVGKRYGFDLSSIA